MSAAVGGDIGRWQRYLCTGHDGGVEKNIKKEASKSRDHDLVGYYYTVDWIKAPCLLCVQWDVFPCRTEFFINTCICKRYFTSDVGAWLQRAAGALSLHARGSRRLPRLGCPLRTLFLENLVCIMDISC